MNCILAMLPQEGRIIRTSGRHTAPGIGMRNDKKLLPLKC